jgi:putative protease
MPLKKKSKKTPLKKKILRKKIAKKTAVKKPVRKAAKKPVKKALKKPLSPQKSPKMGKILGVITHYFPKVQAAVIKLAGPLAVGDTIRVKGHTTDFTEDVTSIQLDHEVLNSAKKGQEIGLQVKSRVRKKDTVYKI